MEVVTHASVSLLQVRHEMNERMGVPYGASLVDCSGCCSVAHSRWPACPAVAEVHFAPAYGIAAHGIELPDQASCGDSSFVRRGTAEVFWCASILCTVKHETRRRRASRSAGKLSAVHTCMFFCLFQVIGLGNFQRCNLVCLREGCIIHTA